jgi:hypothetical protein
MKRRIIVIQKRYLLTFYLIFSFLQLAAQNCCDNPDCANTAKKYAEAELQLMQVLAESPSDSLGRVGKVNNYKASHPGWYQKVTELFLDIDNWAGNDNQKLICLQDQIKALPIDIGIRMSLNDWQLHFLQEFDKIKQRSTEFCQGFGVHAELNQGAVNLFKSTESHFFSVKAFVIVKTWGTSSSSCGGKVRLLLGGGMNYQYNDVMWIIAPRIEYRLKDIGNHFTSIGHIKFIFEPGYGISPDTFQYLTGLGVDINILQVQLLGGYQSRNHNYLAHLGLAYRFFKKY